MVYAANTPSKAYDLQYAVHGFTGSAVLCHLCGNTLDAPRPRRRTPYLHRVKAKTPAHATRGGTRQSVFILVSVTNTIEHALYNKEDPINHYWAVWNMKACAARAIM